MEAIYNARAQALRVWDELGALFVEVVNCTESEASTYAREIGLMESGRVSTKGMDRVYYR